MPVLLSDLNLSEEIVIACEDSSESSYGANEVGIENEHDNYTCDYDSDFEPECCGLLWKFYPSPFLVRALTICCECPSIMALEMRRLFFLVTNVMFKK